MSADTAIPLRDPSIVMKLDRLGSFHPTRLSFTRTLVRRMSREDWRIEMRDQQLDADGYGTVVYRVATPENDLSFVAFSTQIEDCARTDRVIADRWDLTFALVNGAVTRADVERLSKQVPRQESGRMSKNEIVLSRANKSLRLFDYVVDSLSQGRQPDLNAVARVGYLIRTTAVYGNGKYGCMDFSEVQRSTPFILPFQAEMLTVFMARQLSFDLVEHIARHRSLETAVPLAKAIKRGFGVGNATGLGMAPFLVGHPQLFHTWLYIRESAIAAVRAVERATLGKVNQFAQSLSRYESHLSQWQTADEIQMQRLVCLRSEIERVKTAATAASDTRRFPWNALVSWAQEKVSLEMQELINSILLEIYPEIINDFERQMGAEESLRLDAMMSLRTLKRQIESHYRWALRLRFDCPDADAIFWYFSQDKEEPRIGRRRSEPGSDKEMRVGIARDVFRLYRSLEKQSDCQLQRPVAEFLLEEPAFRFIITRIQSLKDYPYAEIQDNLLDADCRPIDLLRCKLAIFGATRFDPKSDLWTRITLFQGAPLCDELGLDDADDWAFPSFGVCGRTDH